MSDQAVDGGTGDGDTLLRTLSALASPHRLRILAALLAGRQYVSRLARDIGISRPLLHMHLQRLESAGLVTGELELSEDGKAMKFYSVAPFDIRLTPESIGEAVRILTIAPEAAQEAARDAAREEGT
jgi:DNA-binding transcriptional ArsR family regulator